MSLLNRLLSNWTYFSVLLVLLFIESALQADQPREVKFSSQKLSILVDGTQYFDVKAVGKYDDDLVVNFYEQHDGIVQLFPSSVELPVKTNPSSNNSLVRQVCILGLNPGRLDIIANITPSGIVPIDNLYLRVTVQHSNAIYLISNITGWMYFLAWSISFYPQIWVNYKRKSVVGLNFDFVGLNIVGFILYSVFNLGLFYIPEVQEEYFSRYPRGLNPVQVNDIFFALHAVFATFIVIVQCSYYERDSQAMSFVTRGILSIFALILIISSILSGVAILKWLDFLYICSYIKLAITLIKYMPQAYMNYRRKSTVGWSIGNIFLDFTGGTLSMLQMILNAYNYSDWKSIFGDPTKFGLGLFSVIFDIFFIIQHYVLYRESEPYMEIPSEVSPDNDSLGRNVNVL